jgi:hypothetical protein
VDKSDSKTLKKKSERQPQYIYLGCLSASKHLFVFFIKYCYNLYLFESELAHFLTNNIVNIISAIIDII